jgi:hypothetical protein
VSAKRNASGEFELEFLAPGPITVHGDDFASFKLDSPSLQPGAEVDLGTIRVDPGLSIPGIAMNDLGAPVANAKITFVSIADGQRTSTDRLQNAPGMREAVADSNGTFTISHVAQGSYAIRATAQGYATSSYIYEFEPNVQLELVLPRAGRVVCEVSKPAKKRREVRLVSSDSENPQTYETKLLEGRTAAAIEGVLPGVYNVSCAGISHAIKTEVVGGETTLVQFD